MVKKVPPNKDKVYQLKVTLKGSKPGIWRRILVKGGTRLSTLHEILQDVMGWDGYHLHQFIVGNRQYGVPDPEYGSMMSNEKNISLAEIAPDEKSKFIYEYDFGDGWEHEIAVEKILEPEEGKLYPICIGGERACPPEDCGGIWGYAHLLEVIKKPKSREDRELLDWLGDEYDPDFFNLKEVNVRLKNYKRAKR